jgi:hypothetical protein
MRCIKTNMGPRHSSCLQVYHWKQTSTMERKYEIVFTVNPALKFPFGLSNTLSPLPSQGDPNLTVIALVFFTYILERKESPLRR